MVLQNRAAAHTTRVTTVFLNAKNINVMDVTTKLRDLKVNGLNWIAASKDWHSATKHRPSYMRRFSRKYKFIKELRTTPSVTSIRRHCQTVSNRYGGHTGYKNENYHWHSSFRNIDILNTIIFIGHVCCICICYEIKSIQYQIMSLNSIAWKFQHDRTIIDRDTRPFTHAHL